MVDLATVEVLQDDVGWLVKVTNVGVRPQEYRCASKQQAESLAAVLSGSKAATGTPRARVGVTAAAAPAAKPGGPAPAAPAKPGPTKK